MAAVLNAEEEVYRLCSQTEDVTQINIERGEEYIFNSRNQKLHVRSYWPAGETKAIIISLHGYAAHNNRPTQRHMSHQFTENGLAYICLDFHGHGYSDGLRALVSSLDNLLDDCVSLLQAIYSDSNRCVEYVGEDGRTIVPRFNLNNPMKNIALNVPQNVLEILENDENVPENARNVPEGKNVPSFLMGHSMGGSTAIALAHYLSDKKNFLLTDDEKKISISSLFKGSILFCPAINIKVPSPVIVSIMDYFIVPLFGHYSVPEFIQATSSNRTEVWKNQDYIAYVERDGYPTNPQSLGFCQPIRFQTGSTLLKLAARCKSVMGEIEYPFIVFHDPEDKIVLYEGTKTLFERSKTDEKKKCCVNVIGGLHDIISNELTFVTKKCIEWIGSQLKGDDMSRSIGGDSGDKSQLIGDGSLYGVVSCDNSQIQLEI